MAIGQQLTQGQQEKAGLSESNPWPLEALSLATSARFLKHRDTWHGQLRDRMNTETVRVSITGEWSFSRGQTEASTAWDSHIPCP